MAPRPVIQESEDNCPPEALVECLRTEPGVVMLRSEYSDPRNARFSFVTARPFLVLRARGSSCELASATQCQTLYGNPWSILDSLMARYELLDEVDLPFPLGGCFGCWGYDLKNFVEPKLPRRAVNDLDLPDCHVGFYDSLVVFDHSLAKTWLVSTGLKLDGTRDAGLAQDKLEYWAAKLSAARRVSSTERSSADSSVDRGAGETPGGLSPISSNLSRDDFIALVNQAQRYIRSGDIYQVNLAHRLSAACPVSPWALYQRLATVSPAPFAAYLDCIDFQIASSSPELFLLLSGPFIRTQPIKGTRPRATDPTRDAQLALELQASPKERAELVMITDLLRNDLGRVCDYGSIQVPAIARLESFPQVHHLVSTVEGRLRPEISHFAALAACFPGGSVTGAPKIRAMEIIDELEPITRGPYTGCLGFLGFNRESQLSIAIRTAVCGEGYAYFHAGAGIVSDSIPEAEYEETITKAAGFLRALAWDAHTALPETQWSLPAEKPPLP